MPLKTLSEGETVAQTLRWGHVPGGIFTRNQLSVLITILADTRAQLRKMLLVLLHQYGNAKHAAQDTDATKMDKGEEFYQEPKGCCFIFGWTFSSTAKLNYVYFINSM